MLFNWKNIYIQHYSFLQAGEIHKLEEGNRKGDKEEREKTVLISHFKDETICTQRRKVTFSRVTQDLGRSGIRCHLSSSLLGT